MNTLKFLLRSLFSNEAIIKEGRKQKWWLTVLVLLLSIIISLIPAFVSILNTNGSAIISNAQTQNIDYSLERFSFEYMNGSDAKIDLKIVDGKMTMAEGKTFKDLEDAKTIQIKGGEEVSFLEIGRENEPTLLVTYVDFKVRDNPSYDNIGDKMTDVRNALAVYYPTSDPVEEDGYSTSKLKSLLLFTEEYFGIYVYNYDATTKFKIDNGVIDLKDTASPAGMTGSYIEIEERNQHLNSFFNKTTPAQTVERWKSFFDQAYQPTKMANLGMTLIIYSSLNVLVILIMSLTIVIMSRFKSAQCGKIGFGNALKLISFAALCPSILGMIISFAIVSLQSIGFLMFVGFRCIFLSTRLTRGEMPETPNKKEPTKKEEPKKEISKK